MAFRGQLDSGLLLERSGPLSLPYPADSDMLGQFSLDDPFFMGERQELPYCLEPLGSLWSRA